jgi:hypothetical protein
VSERVVTGFNHVAFEDPDGMGSEVLLMSGTDLTLATEEGQRAVTA